MDEASMASENLSHVIRELSVNSPGSMLRATAIIFLFFNIFLSTYLVKIWPYNLLETVCFPLIFTNSFSILSKFNSSNSFFLWALPVLEWSVNLMNQREEVKYNPRSKASLEIWGHFCLWASAIELVLN